MPLAVGPQNGPHCEGRYRPVANTALPVTSRLTSTDLPELPPYPLDSPRASRGVRRPISSWLPQTADSRHESTSPGAASVVPWAFKASPFTLSTRVILSWHLVSHQVGP